jgi:hypothetical protein
MAGLGKPDAVYRTGATQAGTGASFGEFLVNDPMFARNMANRLWRQMFNSPAELVDGLDPERPVRQSAAGAVDTSGSHACSATGAGTAQRQFVQSMLRIAVVGLSAQLELRAVETDYVPPFARHYPRRLRAKRSDAIVKATGVRVKYTVASARSGGGPCNCRSRPGRSNSAALNFANTFAGHRDTPAGGSILQQLI